MRRRWIKDKHELVWDGRAVWRPSFDSALPGGDRNLWMCADDAGLLIWAHFDRAGRRRAHHSKLQLTDCSDELGDILADSVSQNGYGETIEDAVPGFVRMVATHIVSTSAAHYEIRCGWDESVEPRKMRAAQLMFLAPTSLMGRGRWRFQSVETRIPGVEQRSQIVRLDPTRLITFDAPQLYRVPLRKMRIGLRRVGRSEDKWLSSFDPNNVVEDFKTVARKYSTERARIVRRIGWNGRGQFRDYIADYQFFDRHLRWLRFCILLRDSILTTLSKSFALIGKLYGETPKLLWPDMPQIADVEAAEKLLIKGAQFDEVTKAFN